jgi:type I restriction enzyme S subunit
MTAWPTKKLGELCETGAGGTPLKARGEYYEGGTIPWLLSGEVSQGDVRAAKHFITRKGLDSSAARLFPADTVLVAMYGATAGQVGILRLEAATNQAICGILPGNHFIPEFLFYLLLARKDELVAQAVGNAQPNISQLKIRNVAVPLVPLREQRRIVGILEEAFEGFATAKANAEKNLQNARALFGSRLQSVFSQRGEGWVERRLEQVGTTQTGSTPKTSEGDNYGDFIPFLKPADFNADGSLNYENEGLTEKGLYEARRVAAGSVLMVCIGATIGKCGYSDRDTTANQQINSLTPTDGSSHRFLYYQMLAETFQHRVIYGSSQATLPIINKSKWSALPVWLPPTVTDQERIAVQLDALALATQCLESTYQQKLTALEALKKSLLHQAFTGQL